VLRREELLRQVWGYNYYGGARTVDVHVRRLRSKMEDGERRPRLDDKIVLVLDLDRPHNLSSGCPISPGR